MNREELIEEIAALELDEDAARFKIVDLERRWQSMMVVYRTNADRALRAIERAGVELVYPSEEEAAD
ncbi:MAG: hypothetical protein AAFY06_00135 [Pseudomonadota bacterium]